MPLNSVELLKQNTRFMVKELFNQSINIRLLRHDKMQANKIMSE